MPEMRRHCRLLDLDALGRHAERGGEDLGEHRLVALALAREPTAHQPLGADLDRPARRRCRRCRADGTTGRGRAAGRRRWPGGARKAGQVGGGQRGLEQARAVGGMRRCSRSRRRRSMSSSRSRLRRRSSTGVRPVSCAARSTRRSSRNSASGLPAPRIASTGTVLLNTQSKATWIAGMRYRPEMTLARPVVGIVGANIET
ncbi:MAG: hypothetical protein U1E23_03345 [Reyranellaceae bacterium]